MIDIEAMTDLERTYTETLETLHEVELEAKVFERMARECANLSAEMKEMATRPGEEIKQMSELFVNLATYAEDSAKEVWALFGIIEDAVNQMSAKIDAIEQV